MFPYIIIGLVSLILLLFLIAIIRTLCVKTKKASYEMSKDQKRIDEYALKLSKMVQFETISERGNPQVEKFRAYHQVLEQLFPILFSNTEKIEIDGNLLLKWNGTNKELDPIILISHQDVVEATGEWLYPPFSGKIVDGRIYGRGTGDIKGGVFSFYQAVEELIKEGYTPKCDVYLGSSCTEEIGGDGAPKLVNYFKERNIHLFMLSDEGGCITNDPLPGIKGAFAAVGVFEKGYGDLKITATSNGGHSSTPSKNTPIARLAAFENYVETHKVFKAKYSKAFIAMFDNLAPYASSFLLKMVLCNFWLFRPILKPLLVKLSPEASAMLKTTICFTMQKGSDGANVIPHEAWVTANLRYIPHQGLEESNALIDKLCQKYNLKSEFILGNNATKALDLNGQPFMFTKECINKVFPNVGVMPYIVTGGTDSRFFDPICDNCVRFSPIYVTGEQMKGMHGIDENIYSAVLPNAVDYFKELIKMQEKR